MAHLSRWLLGIVVMGSFGCGASFPSHRLEGEEQIASREKDAQMRALCTRHPEYAPPQDTELAPIELRLRVELSRTFRTPVEGCLLLDGAPVRGWTTKNGTMFVRTQVTPTVPHRLTFASDFDGAGSFRSYHFRVESRHEFAVARAHDANRLTIRLFEAGEDLPLEQRPTVYWAEAGEVRGMTPPRNAR